MTRTAGLWIDHRKTMIVTAPAGDEIVQLIARMRALFPTSVPHAGDFGVLH